MNKYFVSSVKSTISFLIIILFVFTPVSCSEERDVFTADPANGMKSLEFKISLSDFNESSDANPTEQENAIKQHSLFLFHNNGEELVQEERHHEIKNEKITVAIPESEIGEGLKAYLVANMTFSDDPITEAELLQLKSTRRPEDFISDGFPMCTSALPVLSGDASPIVIEASLQRVPSALYVEVEENAAAGTVYNNSYRIEMEGLQIQEGALFSNTVTALPAQGKTDYSSKLTAVNTPENIAYFYQSQQIKIYITPNDPNLGKAKIITIENSESVVRNKRFLLKIKPVKTIKKAIDFRIQVTEWETAVILVEVPLLTHVPHEPGTLFAEGVSLDTGWYDQNKSRGQEGFSQDSKLCWAATSSNMIQWWQDRYIADGNVLPVGVPNGFTPGREHANFRQLAVFETFASHFPNQGNMELKGMIWYFPKYFPEIFPNIDHFFDHSFFEEKYPNNVKAFSEFIIKGFQERGVCSITTVTPHHIRTFWGCKYNVETGIIESIYLTESDDKDIVLWWDVPISVSSSGKLMVGPHEIHSVSVLYAYPGRSIPAVL
ncbi:fimbrial protein [Flavobacterium sp. CAU 1735]|uniref:IdeS/Mac family cysteine endopeptidase n=1 Tax=Flavobacterium sp. CAU 1735 TaxID=3140361 RepID=UPI00325FE339